MSARILNAALGYAALGVAVFPATSMVKKSCKSAQFSNGERWGATRDLRQVRQDFTRWNGCRIGVPTGAINKIVVVDIDTVAGHGVDGAAALAALELQHGVLPDTRQAASPSGSTHRYFRHPGAGIKIRNSAGELGDGIDVRGDGGCIIAPPSINPDGRQYRWLNRNPLAEMPAWLVELTRDKPLTISQRAVAVIRHPVNGSNAYAAAALEYEIAALANTAPGTRNAALNRASFSLHQLVAGGELDGGEVEHHLLEAATANGLVDDDGIKAVQATIASGRRAGLQHPRSRGAAR
jgi:putative DNA primase/helicase